MGRQRRRKTFVRQAMARMIAIEATKAALVAKGADAERIQHDPPAA